MDTQTLWQIANKGAEWLVAEQGPDGRWARLEEPATDAYYKAAWALALTGHAVQAHRALDYAAAELLTNEGDFQPRTHPWHNEVHHLYSNAYFVIGGMRTGRYDVAMPALQFILSLQSPSSGAFASILTEGDDPVRYDTMSTAAAGLACLAAGRLDAACAAGDWLAELIERQPEPERYLLCTADAENELVATYAEEDAAWRVVRVDQPDQIWYAVGLPYALMLKLHQACGKTKYLEQARWLFDFQERCVNPWSGPSSGKAGWACAEWYRTSGSAHLREVALQVGAYMAQFQAPDGSFPCPPSTEFDPEHVYGPADYDLTAEYTLWLAEIASNVEARDEA